MPRTEPVIVRSVFCYYCYPGPRTFQRGQCDKVWKLPIEFAIRSWRSYKWQLVWVVIKTKTGLLWWLCGKESTCQCKRHRFNPWVGTIPWRRKWQPTPLFLSGKAHEQRSLVGYSPWGHKRVGHDWVTKHSTALTIVGVHFKIVASYRTSVTKGHYRFEFISLFILLCCFCLVAKSCPTLLWPHGL